MRSSLPALGLFLVESDFQAKRSNFVRYPCAILAAVVIAIGVQDWVRPVGLGQACTRHVCAMVVAATSSYA